MSDGKVEKEDLFKIIKHGNRWYAEKIKEEIENLKCYRFSDFNLRNEDGNKYYYVYNNDCYLYIFNGKIESRCERENVYSSDKTFTYEIKEASDIQLAYERFLSMTMEDDEN